MASFCQQCSIDMFGGDTRDLAGVVTEEEFKNGAVGEVLCETCGWIYVDHNGKRTGTPEEAR